MLQRNQEQKFKDQTQKIVQDQFKEEAQQKMILDNFKNKIKKT